MSKHIELTQGKVAVVDDEDFESLNQWKWCYDKSNGYAHRNSYLNVKKEKVYLHRFILQADRGTKVDHIDRDKLNNQKSNLRIATQAQNTRNQNRHSDSLSRFKGVHWYPNRAKAWLAKICVDYKQINLGFYHTEAEAALAYDEAAQELHGAFALLNFPVAPLDTLHGRPTDPL